VKNSIRIFSAGFLIAIYCFAIGVVTKSLVNSDFHSNSATLHEQYFSDFSTKLFCLTSQPESSVNNYINQLVPSYKNPFNGFWAIPKITEQLFETAFSLYTNISKNFLIQHRKSDIIFPFHYFW